jgi:hypothetical protein
MWHKKNMPSCVILQRPCQGSGSYLPASHRGGPGSRPCQSMWDLWWEKLHWDRFLSDFFGFPLSVSFHRGSPHSHVTSEKNSRSVNGRSSETQSHHNDMNNHSAKFITQGDKGARVLRPYMYHCQKYRQKYLIFVLNQCLFNALET